MTAPPQGPRRTTSGRYGRALRDAWSAHAQPARRSQDPRVDATTTRRKAGPGAKQSHTEGTSGGGPQKGRDRDAASRCTARQRQKKGCALSCRDCAGGQDRPTPVTRTSTHTGSPLIENARSLRRTFGRVNREKPWLGELKSSSAKVQEYLHRHAGADKKHPGYPGGRSWLASEDTRKNALPPDRSGNARATGPPISWRWPAAGPAPNGCGRESCRVRTASRRFPGHGSATPTAGYRSGRGWPG